MLKDNNSFDQITTPAAGGSPSRSVTRRTIAKGVAWTAPVVAIAGAAPSMAASPSLSLKFACACKFSGGSCAVVGKKAYTFFFDAQNPGEDVTITSITFSDTGTKLDPLVYSGTLPLTIAGGSGATDIPVQFTVLSEDSGNLTFDTVMTVLYRHADDTMDHVTTVPIHVPETGPDCTCANPVPRPKGCVST